jgi:lysozyme family protein
MKENYEQALTEVLKSEGGYSNDPGDPGGPTNFGITINDYRSYINAHGTAQDVRRMTLDQAKTIYKSKYWDAVGCDLLPSGIDYCVFDYGVNSGIGRAKRILGEFPTVIKTDPVKAINAICDERINFLRRLGTFRRFGQGWTTRVAHVRALSIVMAHKVTTPTATIPVVQHLTRAWISFGMGGSVFDPAGGEKQLVERCKGIGIDTRNSPYQWSDINAIVADIDKSDTKIIVGGDSLGANEAPRIAASTKHNIDLLFGFQPSEWGEHIQVPANVAEAVCIYNPTWIQTIGLGHYPWSLAPGNKRTKLSLIPIEAPHPDDWGQSQDIIFKRIKEIHSGH